VRSGINIYTRCCDETAKSMLMIVIAMGMALIFNEPSPRRTLRLRLSRPVGRSIRCGAMHASRRFWRKRRWAGSKRWPPSAKPEESDSSAGDFEAAVKVDFC